MAINVNISRAYVLKGLDALDRLRVDGRLPQGTVVLYEALRDALSESEPADRSETPSGEEAPGER